MLKITMTNHTMIMKFFTHDMLEIALTNPVTITGIQTIIHNVGTKIFSMMNNERLFGTAIWKSCCVKNYGLIGRET